MQEVVRNAVTEKLLKSKEFIQKARPKTIHNADLPLITSSCIEAGIQQLQLTYIYQFFLSFAGDISDASVVLQGDKFYPLFVGFPVAKHHRRLMLPILLVDCLHYQSPQYNGVAIVFVSKTGFGRAFHKHQLVTNHLFQQFTMVIRSRMNIAL